jgi:uncharacterized membrane protein
MSRFQILISTQRLGEALAEYRLSLGGFGATILAPLLTFLAAIVIVVALQVEVRAIGKTGSCLLAPLPEEVLAISGPVSAR